MSAVATRRPPYGFAAVLILLGLVLCGGGAHLLLLGGSSYYVLAGAALVASGTLLWRGDRRGSLVYGLLLAATLVWSLFEVGVDLRSLAPRLLSLAALGLWFLTPRLRRSVYSPGAPPPLFNSREGVSVWASVVVVSVTVLALGGFRTPASASSARARLPETIAPQTRGSCEWTEASIWGLTPLDQLWRRIEFRKRGHVTRATTALSIPCRQDLRLTLELAERTIAVARQ